MYQYLSSFSGVVTKQKEREIMEESVLGVTPVRFEIYQRYQFLISLQFIMSLKKKMRSYTRIPFRILNDLGQNSSYYVIEHIILFSSSEMRHTKSSQCNE